MASNDEYSHFSSSSESTDEDETPVLHMDSVEPYMYEPEAVQAAVIVEQEPGDTEPDMLEDIGLVRTGNNNWLVWRVFK